MFKLPDSVNLSLPKMRRIKQQFKVPAAIDISRRIASEWDQMDLKPEDLPGAEIAVCVGSRGISNIVKIVRQVVANLKSAGALPFIVPAMGSHGNATAKGQIDVLAHLGITEKNVGAPVQADMEVVSLGKVDDIPLFISKPAYEADGIVLINRVKPHTDFTGPIESGCLKMLVIGLGNQKGADFYHRMAVKHGFYDMIVTAGRALLEKTNVLFGIPIVENQYHEICDLRMVCSKALEKREEKLLIIARDCLPKLPLDEIDLLIVDQMGKNFSGAGLDPNVMGFSSCKWGMPLSSPSISRVFVRGLSKESKGNGSGIGMVDVATSRLVDQIDWQSTAINAFTACCPEDCKVPMTVNKEQEAIGVALNTIRPYTLDDLKIVHIKNTLELDEMFVSKGSLSQLKSRAEITIESHPLEMTFNGTGNLEYK